MMKKAIAIVLTFTIALSAIADDIVIEFTGRTTVDEKSKQRAVSVVRSTFLDKERRKACPHIVIVAKPSTKPMTKDGDIEEKWTASGCERITNYTVTFFPNPIDGGYIASLDSDAPK